MRTFAVIAGLFVLFSGWQYLRREHNERRLALVATALAGRDVGVDCPGFWTRLVEIAPYSGWVDYDENGQPADETELSGGTCESLEKLWRSDPRPTFPCLPRCGGNELAMINGIVTLAHESWHLRGLVNEAQTQCYALQTTELAARHFGIVPEVARRIAVFAAARDAAQPYGEYRSHDCRSGGPLDLRPETSDWPG